MVNGENDYVLTLSRREPSPFSVFRYTDEVLDEYSPTQVILITCIALAIICVLKNLIEPRWNETYRDKMGRLLLNIPPIKSQFDKLINKESASSIESVKKKWEAFGEPILEIPEVGWTEQKLHELLHHYKRITLSGLEGKHFSGTIYSCSLLGNDEKSNQYSSLPEEVDSSSNDFISISQKIQRRCTEAYEIANLYNSLHSGEFALGLFIDYQVVRMVAKEFGGKPEDVTGLVTSGGTDSLMTMIRVYRDQGMELHGHKPGEGVILVGKSVHAAIYKAAKAYLLNVVEAETDEAGNIDLNDLRRLAMKHKKSLIAIVGSAPSYPTGIIDPIKEMAEIADTLGCGMHVDACLGGFIVNNIHHESDFLTYPGVTSLSADTHKNGQAPKGSSVLVFNKGTKNPASKAIYTVPDWRGGVYGTPNNAGSQSCVPGLTALIAMLGMGKSGYRPLAKSIYNSCHGIAKMIKQDFNCQLKLIVEPQVNVVAFKVDPQFGLPRGASYAFAYEMAKRAFVLSTLSNDMLHFCVTMRFVGDENQVLLKFSEASRDSLIELQRMVQEGIKFSGDAPIYCSLEAAKTPTFKNSKGIKFIENFFFGPLGSRRAIEKHFEAQLG